MAAAPLAPTTQIQSPMAASHDVRLAATEVPPGGLITSFLGNQLIYCSAICGPLVVTAVTAAVTTVQTPVVFVGALGSGNLFKAIGVTAASVTGPTTAALAAAIDADVTVAVPKASNAFEVGVIGLLNVVPAAAGGLPGIITAIQAVRQDTFDALNLPVPVTGPTVMPHGVVQVAALSAIRVGEAIIFPAFNDALLATIAVPNAAAQELAATGDPVQAVAAGVDSAVGSVTAAVNVVAGSVVTGIKDIRTAAGQSSLGNAAILSQKSSTTTTSLSVKVEPSRQVGTIAKHASVEPGSSHPLRDVASKVRQVARSVFKSTSERPHRTVTSKTKT